MKFLDRAIPSLDKPVIIAAMRDMGNVGGIVISFINHSLNTKVFRVAQSAYPDYVLDNRGHIQVPKTEWTYRYTDGLVVFGEGSNQPQDPIQLHSLCQDVVEVAHRYSAKLIYTVGGFGMLQPEDPPRTYISATTPELITQLKNSGFRINPNRSTIRGFNGIILGYSQRSGIRGIGLYGEISQPDIPQYKAAKSILETLEMLTYRRFGDLSKLDELAGYTKREER